MARYRGRYGYVVLLQQPYIVGSSSQRALLFLFFEFALGQILSVRRRKIALSKAILEVVNPDGDRTMARTGLSPRVATVVCRDR